MGRYDMDGSVNGRLVHKLGEDTEVQPHLSDALGAISKCLSPSGDVRRVSTGPLLSELCSSSLRENQVV